MKEKLICLTILILSTTIGIKGQDFASRFMHEVSKDKSIRCETISPRMLETLMKTDDKEESEETKETKSLISKLKSVRIIHAPRHSGTYFQKAETLLDKNKNRFTEAMDECNDENKKIFLRKKDDIILELVLLNLDTLQNKLTIVNLTGEMDHEFIQKLAQDEGMETDK